MTENSEGKEVGILALPAGLNRQIPAGYTTGLQQFPEESLPLRLWNERELVILGYDFFDLYLRRFRTTL